MYYREICIFPWSLGDMFPDGSSIVLEVDGAGWYPRGTAENILFRRTNEWEAFVQNSKLKKEYPDKKIRSGFYLALFF